MFMTKLERFCKQIAMAFIAMVVCGFNTVAQPVSGGQNFTFTLPDGKHFKMVYVEGGTFVMGCTPEQGDQCSSDEVPAHNVTLSGYYLAEYEVTQALWQAVMGTSIYEQQKKAGEGSTYGVGESHAMYYINYTECEEFCSRLNILLRNQLPRGLKFGLPSEAQWEYAARGGVNAKHTIYAGSDNIEEVAWYKENRSSGVKPVGLKNSNELGLYDMSGNVQEWCADWYSSYYYYDGPQQEPKNLSAGYLRVCRGGYWNALNGRICRVSSRLFKDPGRRSNDVGFRMALVR